MKKGRGEGKGKKGTKTYEKTLASKGFAPANRVYPETCSLCGAGSHVAICALGFPLPDFSAGVVG